MTSIGECGADSIKACVSKHKNIKLYKYTTSLILSGQKQWVDPFGEHYKKNAKNYKKALIITVSRGSWG